MKEINGMQSYIVFRTKPQGIVFLFLKNYVLLIVFNVDRKINATYKLHMPHQNIDQTGEFQNREDVKYGAKNVPLFVYYFLLCEGRICNR